MKKKVRIYKSQTGQGQFVNKTAKFLSKAQMGGVPDVEMASYQGASQQTEMSQDQLAQMIISDISNGRPKEETVVKLVTGFSQEPMMADQFYDQIFNSLQAEKDKLVEETDDEEEVENNSQQEQIYNDVIAEEEETKPSMTSTSNDIASENSEDVDDTDAASQLVMQYGGMMPSPNPSANETINLGVYENMYPIQFPGMDATLPAHSEKVYDYFAGEEFKKGGAYKKAKSKYVKSALALKKKQLGGQDEDASQQSDPTGKNVRDQRLQSFISTVKTNSDLAAAQEQAEQEFEKLAEAEARRVALQGYMQEGGFMQTIDPENPMHHLQLYSQAAQEVFGDPQNQVTKFQKGGLPRDQRKMLKRMGRAMERIPGFMPGLMPPVSKFDVTKSGLFGSPRQYSIEFGAPMMPGMVPAMPGTIYGYGAMQQRATQRKTPGRIITEEVAQQTNKKATEEVAANTPESDATNKSAEGTKQTPTSSPSTVVTNSGAGSGSGQGIVVDNVIEEKIGETLPSEKSRQLYTLSSKPGYYYRLRNDGSYVKFKGDPSKHFEGKAPVLENGKAAVITPKSKYYNYLNTESKYFGDYSADAKKPQATSSGKSTTKPGSKELSEADKKAAAAKRASLQKNYGWASGLNPGSLYNDAIQYMQNDAPDALHKAYGDFKHSMYTDSGMEEGGIVNNPFSDPYGNLQRFIYGGNDDPSLAAINQSDIDYVNSKDTTDPYFAMGGLTKYEKEGEVKEGEKKETDKLTAEELELAKKYNINDPGFSPAETRNRIKNEQRNEWIDSQMKNPSGATNPNSVTQMQQQFNPYAFGVPVTGLPTRGRRNNALSYFPANFAGAGQTYGYVQRGPYDPNTGAGLANAFGPGTTLSNIKVTKSGILGRPKKYTMTFNNAEMDPRKQGLITLPTTPTAGSEQAAEQEGAAARQAIFSNTKGMDLNTRAQVAAREALAAIRNRRNTDVASAEQSPTPDIPDAPSAEQLSRDQDPEVIKFRESQKAKGLEWDPSQNRWIPKLEVTSTIPLSDAAKQLMSRQQPELITSSGLNQPQQTQPVVNEFGEIDYTQYQPTPEGYQTDEEYMATDMPDVPEGFMQDPADASFEKGYFGNQTLDRYDALRQYITPSNPQGIKPQPVKPATPRTVPGATSNPSTNQKATTRPITPRPTAPTADEMGRLTPAERAQRDRELREAEQKRPQWQAEKQKRDAEAERQKLANMTWQERQAYTTQNKVNSAYDQAYKEEYDKPLQVLNGRREASFRKLEGMKNLTPAQKKEKEQKIWDIYYAELAKLDKSWDAKSKQYKDTMASNRKQKGGVISFGIPMLQPGGEPFIGANPVVYTNNPAFVGQTDVGMLSLNPGIQGAKGQTNWASMSSPGTVTQRNNDGSMTYGVDATFKGAQPDQYTVDPNQIESYQAEKEYAPDAGEFSVDIKNKRKGAVDTEAMFNVGNAGLKSIAGGINYFNQDDSIYDKLKSDEVYGSTDTIDKGDYIAYGSASGQFRRPGSEWTSRSKQYGGTHKVDDEVYMTDEEIQEFLANGGEIEYL